MIEQILVDGKEINLEIKDETHLTKIYGFNGVGKTRISNYFANKTGFFVFNENYVRDNIYNFSELGIKTTGKQKKNLAQVFISKECFELTQKIQLVKEFNDFLKFNYVNTKNLIISNQNLFDEKYRSIITQNKNIDSILSYFELLKGIFHKTKSPLILDFDLEQITTCLNDRKKLRQIVVDSFLFDLNAYKPKYDKQLLESDYFFMTSKSALENYNYDVKTSTYNAKIDEIINLAKDYNAALISKETYNNSINRVKQIFENLKIDESLYRNPNNSIYEWISKGIKIHNDLKISDEFCLYCGNENINFDKWLKKIELVIEDKISKISQKLVYKTKGLCNVDFKKMLKINPILVDNIGLIQSLVNQIKLLNDKWFQDNIFSRVEKQDYLNLDLIATSLIRTKQEVIEIKNFDLNNLINYSINKLFPKMKDAFVFIVLNDILDLTNKYLMNKRFDVMKSIENKIKWLMEDLNKSQLNPFSLKIRLSNAKTTANNKEVELEIVDIKTKKPIVERLSTGQRNNLAFMLFVAQAREKIMNKEINTIVIDDPVDGGDFFSYFLTKTFIKDYFMANQTRVIVLTHNFDYLLIQLAGTDGFPEFNFEIIKILSDGTTLKLSKEELNSNNKVLYYSLTKHFFENFNIDKTFKNQPFVASWLIWTRKIIEEFLVDNLKLNKGKYIPDCDHFQFILNETDLLLGDQKLILKNYLNNDYYSFISKKISYSQMIKKSKEILKNIFGENRYLSDLCGIIDQINPIESDEKFDKEFFKISQIKTEDNLIKIAHDAARLMILKIYDGKKNPTKEDIANYLKHSGNNISRPIIALETNPILEN